MTARNLFNNYKRTMGNEENHFNRVLWSKDYWEINFPKTIPVFDNTKKYNPLNVYNFNLRTNTFKNNDTYFTELTNTSGKISELYKGEEGNYPDPARPHWEGLVTASVDDFLTVKDLNLKFDHHTHNVLEELSFQDLGVELSFLKEDNTTYNLIFPLLPPYSYASFVGAEGNLNGDSRYQLGLKQVVRYLFISGDKHIIVDLEISIVLMYHGNDFEPLGVIEACKFFPQISYSSDEPNLQDPILFPNLEGTDISTAVNAHMTFEIDNLPTGVNPNSCKVVGYKGKVKMSANNNSTHHVKTVDNGSGQLIDSNYLRNIRDISPLIPIPPMFEKYFDEELLTSNFPGFFTDSNYSEKDEDRKFPIYKVYKAFLPTWAYIFDYVKTDLTSEIEIQGTFGHKDSTTHSSKLKDRGPIKYKWPPNNLEGKSLSLVKKARQGEYDNIHFHGYMGHYADNGLTVIHAPICGYCCLHVHWRWAKLNYNLNSIQILKRQFKLSSGDPNRFNGYDKNGINTGNEFGAPLIPPNQSLKVAITNPTISAYDYDNVLNPNETPAPLQKDVKSVWYSVDIREVTSTSKGKYVIFEQGAGYAFRYSNNVEEVFKNAKTTLRLLSRMPLVPASIRVFIDLNFHLLELSDMFEMTYRLMRVYNTLIDQYTDVEQVPPGTYQPTITEPSMEKL